MTGVSFFTTEAHEGSINELACKEYAGTANETQDSHIHDRIVIPSHAKQALSHSRGWQRRWHFASPTSHFVFAPRRGVDMTCPAAYPQRKILENKTPVIVPIPAYP